MTLLFAHPWFALPRASRAAIAMIPEFRRPSSVAWFPIAVFTLQSTLFFGLSTWLPSAYVERGWTETSAGLLASGLVVSSLVGSLAISPLIDTRRSTNRYLVIASIVAAVPCFGLVVLPAAAWAWTLLAGAASGSLLVLSLKLPLDLSDSADDVAGVTGWMLAIGYSTSGLIPLLLGALRDVSGGFDISFSALGILSVALLLISIWQVGRGLGSAVSGATSP